MRTKTRLITAYSIKTKNGFKSSILIKETGQKIIFPTVFLYRKDALEIANKQKADFLERSII